MRDEPVSDEQAKEAVVSLLERIARPLASASVPLLDQAPHPYSAGAAGKWTKLNAGMEESRPCDSCKGLGAVDGSGCEYCRGHGKIFVYRPAATIVHVPTLRVACGCGRTHDSPVPEVVKDFQRTGMAPPIECGCGRIVIGQRRLVLA